ncbi:MAG: hypothetical protein ABII21_01785 [bacterium]
MNKYLLFFILSFTVFLTHALYTKHALYGDGNGYYATSLSLLTGGTFNSQSVLDYLKNFQGKDYVFSRVFWDTDHNPYSIGTSLFWLPGLALVSVFSGNPYNLIHELVPGVTGILLILGGLYFIERYLLSFFSPRTVFFTILSLYLGSNLFYYSSFEPALSHQPAFFLIAFLLYWTHNFSYSKLNLISLGFLFGLLHITRIADTLLLIPIFFTLKLDLKKLVFITLGGLVAILPQLSVQFYSYGSLLRNFYVTESPNVWSFNLRNVVNYLFSYQKGLFIWSPVYLLGVYGLFKLQKLPMLVSILSLWLLGSFWSASSSMTAGFGQRLSFAAIPYFALGIVHIYEKVKINSQIYLTSLFIAWNVFLTYGFYILKWKNLS